MPVFPELFICISLAGLVVLGGCTTTTTVRPSNLALPGSAAGDAAPGERLRDLSVPALLENGHALLAAGDLGMARLHFAAAAARAPDNPSPCLALGDLALRAGDGRGALAHYRQAAARDPANLAAILGQLRLLREQGEGETARALLNRALQLAPNDPRVLTELAIAYTLQGEENLAAPLFRELAAAAPDAAAVCNNLGVHELTRGNYPLAIVHLSKASLLAEGDATIANNLAMAFALYGQEDQALKLYTRTVGAAAAWNNLGYLYMTRQRYDDAERAFRKALDLSPVFYARARANLDHLAGLRQAAR